ncbi:hypothetical protein [Micropruina sp.]|uniref:hypothetical protein n=1 Tax=Micropruina sp. TaxID=2737536 RepID=UPI0039E30F92
MPRDVRPISANARRARQLMAGGAMGGHIVALFVVPLMLWTRGPSAGLSALVAALATLAFMGLGQWVQVRYADAAPQQMMLAWFVSYLLRVGVPGVVLFAAAANPERLAGMDRLAVAVTTICVVVGWLAAEIWVFSRLRIPVFDPPDDTSH